MCIYMCIYMYVKNIDILEVYYLSQHHIQIE